MPFSIALDTALLYKQHNSHRIYITTLRELNMDHSNKISDEPQTWLGLVPGQCLPKNFLEMDATALRQLFEISTIPNDVWNRAKELFDGDESNTVSWLFTPTFGLKEQRPIDVLKSDNGKQAVLTLIAQIEYGICP